MSTERELVTRNIELSAEFGHYLFEHPELEQGIPLDAEVVLLPESDAELRAFNLRIGKQMQAEGEEVAFIAITKMRPRSLSRIEELSLSPAV